MNGFDKLQLSTETLRELSGQELDKVAGGVQPPTLQGCWTGPQTYTCPTFTSDCDTLLCK